MRWRERRGDLGGRGSDESRSRGASAKHFEYRRQSIFPNNYFYIRLFFERWQDALPSPLTDCGKAPLPVKLFSARAITVSESHETRRLQQTSRR